MRKLLALAWRWDTRRDAAEVMVERTYGAVYASLFRLCSDGDLAADLLAPVLADEQPEGLRGERCRVVGAYQPPELGEFRGGFFDAHVVDGEFERLDFLLRGVDISLSFI